MRNVSGNKLIRAFFLVCVLMQIVAAMPHHHHGDSDAACYFHFEEHQGSVCEAHCADGHEHHDAPVPACQSHQIVMTEPEYRKAEMTAEVIALPERCGCWLSSAGTECGKVEYHTSVMYEQYRCRPFVEPVLIRFISTLCPSRAPDFTA